MVCITPNKEDPAILLLLLYLLVLFASSLHLCIIILKDSWRLEVIHLSLKIYIMFSSFFIKKDTTNSATSASVSSKEIIKEEVSDDDDDSETNLSNWDLNVEMGGGKGWPADATCILYHHIQGLICVGTESGSIYVFGDGFQFMRPWLTNDPNKVSSIVQLHHNHILVLFEDNSVVVMELPTLDIVDLLTPSWMDGAGRNPGDISVVYVDVPGEKNFVYIGTTEGLVLVLEVQETSIRICDFKLTWQELGLPSSMVVCDLSSSPKDDKFLAVGFGGSQARDGAIVIFDLVKHKVLRTFSTAAITSMDWMHTGDVLFAGTRHGELLSVNTDKTQTAAVWSADSERLDGSTDEDEDEECAAVVARRIAWMAPQTSSPDGGCLFVHLAPRRGHDEDGLKSVVVALTPAAHGTEMELAFSLPPIAYEDVLAFRVVPTYDKAECGATSPPVVPGLLLLVEKHLNAHHDADEDDGPPVRRSRQLRIVRCPAHPVSEWALEIGTTPDPRKATEVMPSSSEITCIAGLAATFGKAVACSLSATLLAQLEVGTDGQVASDLFIPPVVSTVGDDGCHDPAEQITRGPSRRLSTRDFLSANNLISELEASLGEAEAWEMALASGVQQLQRVASNGTRRNRLQDVVFKGHADGTVIAWGVSLPVSGQELGRGNVWLPLRAFRCGSTEVRVIAHDEEAGLFVAADESGLVVVWEAYDVGTGRGAADLLQSVLEHARTEGEEMDVDALVALRKDYRPSDFREVLRTQLKEPVSAVLLLPHLLTLFVGTEDGSVFGCSDFHASSGKALRRLEGIGGDNKAESLGPVLGLHFGQYRAFESTIPSVFVYFHSGILAVVEHNSMSCLATFSGSHCGASLDEGVSREHVSDMVLVNSAHVHLEPPSVLATTQAVSAAAAAAMTAQRNRSATTASEAGGTTPPPPAKPSRISMFGSKSALRATTPPPVPATASATTASEPVDEEAERAVPKYLMLIRGRSILAYDLGKPARPQSQPTSGGGLWKSSHSSYNVGAAQLMSTTTSRSIAKTPVVASSVLRYTDADGEEETVGLGCINSKGVFVLVSVRHRAPISHLNLLEGVVDTDCADVDGSDARFVSMGAVLSNGNCYFVSGTGNMVYSATASSEQHVLSGALPDRASPQSAPPVKALSLLHGRESQLAQLRATLRKRRSSVINISAAPTDLYKVFARSREVKQRDDLMEGASSRGTEDEDSRARTANRGAIKTMSDMSQVRQNFEERGQRINQIALKMDSFKESASQYRQTVARQKDALKKKNSRWGLF